jgi:DNA-directed RNA polymerase alpha subunit
MSQFFISCKESRIENNKSFYGCFYLGPFEPSQSITIANALRRTLLSELYGLGIVSVEIEGANHEYSSLPGVKDSVLDILLNLKEIVLKKTIKNFKPQIGYLRVRGPGVVRASHLRLPPFIQSVDPDQYIATLADNGFLNMKFIIQYGNKWLSPRNSLSGIYAQPSDNKEDKEDIKNIKNTNNDENIFNLHLKKRRLILKKLKQIGITSSNLYIKMFSQSAGFFQGAAFQGSNRKTVPGCVSKNYKKKINIPKLNIAAPFNKKYSAINLKNASGAVTFKKLSKSIEKAILAQKGTAPAVGPFPQKNSNKKIAAALKGSALKKYNFESKQSKLRKESKLKINSSLNFMAEPSKLKTIFFNANPLTIDAVFNPINKVNYIIEINDFKTAASKMQTSYEISELYEMLKTTNSIKTRNLAPSSKKIDTHLKNYMQTQLIKEQQLNASSFKTDNATSEELESVLEIKRQINTLKKDTIKHNITLEIWTNGSIHPRDALYQGFKNLIKLFAKLKKINSFVGDSFYPLQSNTIGMVKENKNSPVDVFYGETVRQSLAKYAESNINNKITTNNDYPLKKELPFASQKNVNMHKPLLKKIKMGEINTTFLKDLLPLNDTSFLSTYVDPKLKNYYLTSFFGKTALPKQQGDCLTATNDFSDGDCLTKAVAATSVKKTKTPYELAYAKSTDSLNSNNFERFAQADIGMLNLSLRSYTCLKRLGINSIEELLSLSQNNQLKLNILKSDSTKFITGEEVAAALEGSALKKKLGNVSLKEIQKSLEKLDLYFKI